MSLKIFSKSYDGSFLDASTENGVLTTYHNLVTYQTKNNTIFLQADDNEEYNLIELSLKGKEYYLDLSTVNGDYEGDWYGNIYADEKKEMYVGHLKLSHFRSAI